MAWIFLAESADSPSPSEGMSSRSFTVRTTDTHKVCFSQECPAEKSPSHLSGMTLELCEESDSLLLTSSTADSLAKTLAWQDAEQAWRASEADYFSRSQGSSAKYDPDSYSWRTSQQLLFEAQSELLESFAAYGMTVDGAFYPLQMWERTTGEKDGGSWPTPRASEWKGCGPKGSKSQKYRLEKRYLDATVLEQEQNGGSLNPTWVEWLMGYPGGWTVCEPWAMPSSRNKPGKRSSA